MAGRLAILCPGQGAQHPAMFDMARQAPAADGLLNTWFDDPALGATLHAGLGDARFTNRIAQPAIVAATLAMWAALRDTIAQPALVAGYSIGELSAYGVAGALAPDDAIRLASERARLMDACVAAGAGQGMVALSGMPAGSIEALVQRCGFYPAIVTGDDALVAGGPAERRDRSEERRVVKEGYSQCRSRWSPYQ